MSSMDLNLPSWRGASRVFMRSPSCLIQMEDRFGPQVDRDCLEGFDFTLLFEESILSISLLSMLLLATAPRVLRLLDNPQKVYGGWFHLLKLFGWAVLAAWELILLVIWSQPSTPRTHATIPSAALACACSLSFCFLSHLEHMRSIQPSKILQLFLFFSTLLDIPRTRTLWAIRDNWLAATMFTVIMGWKVVMLLLESMEKRHLLKPTYRQSSRESTSGMFSRGLFWWLNSQLMKGYHTVMSMDDLFAIDSSLSCEDTEGGGLQSRWESILNKGNKQALLLASIQHYKWHIAAGIVPRSLQIGFLFSQPFLVTRVVRLMTEPDTPYATYSGYGLIAAYALVYVGIAVSTTVAQHKAFRVITMMRSSIVSMIYGKSMQLPSTGVDENAPVTLMSADIERITSGVRYINDAWACLVEIPIALWLLYRELGVAGIAPIVVALVCAILAVGLSAMSRDRQKLWLEAIEERVSATSKMLSSMKGVKTTGLSDRLYTHIQNMKEDEITKSQKFRELLIAAAAVAYGNSAVAPVVSFAIYALRARATHSEPLTAAKAFYALALFSLLAVPIGNLVESATGLAAAVGSIQRIDTFLQEKPWQDGRSKGIVENLMRPRTGNSRETTKRGGRDSLLPTEPDFPSEVVVARNRSAGWGKEKDDVLRNMNFDIRPSTLTVIIGPVGSGKSTILNAVLGEIPHHDGYLWIVASDVAYCGQTPWLTNKTLQQNILGESLIDVHWYNEVVRACALEQDIKLLPLGDQTMLGTNGAVLSGGQKQRLALARAVYSRKSMVILDDPVSGLDPITEDRVVSNLFGAKGIFREHGTSVIMATNNLHCVPLADYIIALGPDGTIAQQGSFEELNATEGYVRGLLVQKRDRISPTQEEEQENTFVPPPGVELEPLAVEGDRRTGDTTVYLYYIKAVGVVSTVIFVGLLSVYVVFLSLPAIWVQIWTFANEEDPNNENLGLYLGVYFFLSIMAITFIVLSAWHLMAHIVSRAARVLHTRLLRTALNAPMSFFTTTDVGITTNRFTQDLQLIDMELPLSLLNTVLSSLTCLAQLIVISVSTKYLAATIPVCITVFYFIQRFYLRTSRQLRFMEIEAKSPLFSNFLETLSGLSTIRAFGWQTKYQERNHELLETSQKPFYLLFCIQRWLELVVGLCVAGFAVLLVGVAIGIRSNGNVTAATAGFIGVALINIITFGENVQALILHWTVLETSIGAVSRIRAFAATTESENRPGEDGEVPRDWPSRGNIEFRDVTASYDTKKDSVLKGVSISIPGGQRIGICGRSGSGKSSLISTVLRMLELNSGSIYLDDIDLSTISRQEIRSRLIVIPQEPYFLPGSVRLNVDPSGSHTDDVIIGALQKTHLWDVIQKQGGLDAVVTDELLSHGQRQLLCLSSAMLRKGMVLILDEATSSVDTATDDLMQRIIRSEFPTHTILAIAHRLDTILDFDQVMVIDKGVVVETGNPKALLARESVEGEMSHFAILYESLDNSRGLKRIADETRDRNRSRSRSRRNTLVTTSRNTSASRRSSLLRTVSMLVDGTSIGGDDEGRPDRWSMLWRELLA